MAYFDCTIGSAGEFSIPLVVTCTANFAGQTITCSDGTTTLTGTCPSASPYEVEFELPNTGTWTVSGTISGQTYSDSILVNEFDAELVDIIDITVDVYSAANDTISYVGIDSQTHTITTDSNGHASATITINGNGSSLTFTSSVAKDPSNLSNDYTKTISLNPSTSNVYVCPDGALYWYGYEKVSLTAKAINDSTVSGSVAHAPTVQYNTNNVQLTMDQPSNGTYRGPWITNAKIDFSQYGHLKCIAHDNALGTNSIWPRMGASLTDVTGYTAIPEAIDLDNTTSSPILYSQQTDISQGSEQFAFIKMLNSPTRNCKSVIDAFWLE